MTKWLRENPTLAFGLGLPLLLVLGFLLASGIPAWLVEAPRHELIYATQYTHYANPPSGWQIAVVGDKVQVHYVGSSQTYQNPRLWRFNPQTGAVKEIALLLPAGLSPATAAEPEKTPKVTPVAVPDLATVKVDASSVAPDGYAFRSGSEGYGSRPLDGFFYSSRYRQYAELEKDGRRVRLPHTEGAGYGESVRLIGWVVNP